MTPSDYFVSEALDAIDSKWWSSLLTCANEVPICTVAPDQPTTLRVCRVPAFRHASIVRAARTSRGWHLVSKVIDGPRYALDGQLVWEHTHTLVGPDAEQLQQLIDGSQLWAMPTTTARMGLDGEMWLIECAQRGKYHVLYRWSPEEQPLLALAACLWLASGVDQYRPDPHLELQRNAERASSRASAERAAELRAARIRRSNVSARTLAATLGSDGLTCPHCCQHTKDIRFVDNSRSGESYFVCKQCGRTFVPADLEPLG